MSDAWSNPAFERLARLVAAETGLNLASRHADTEAGIRRAMQRLHVNDPAQFASLVETGKVPLDDLVSEVTVGETYFFREQQHFDFIRQTLFPEVLERRGHHHVLRLWSAGCATGEEAYSLAIALEDAGVDGHVVATDVSRSALLRARHASYRRWSLRGVDDMLVRRCFHSAGSQWTLDERFRRPVTFEFLNLARGIYPSVPAGLWGMDLILCRNVLIYLDPDTVRRVARGLSDTLADGGWLLTGSSDPPLTDVSPSLQPVMTGNGVFYRKRRVAVAPNVPVLAAPIEIPDAGRAISTLSVANDALQSSAAAVAPPPGAATAAVAFAAGDYAHVLATTQPVRNEADAALRVRALANQHGSERALKELRPLLARFPLSAELHLLDAVLRLDLNREDEAGESLRRVLYLDRSLVMANFLLAVVLRRQRRVTAARRAYRNARDLAKAHPADRPLPLSDGERASTIVAIADAEIALLDSDARAAL